MKKLPKQCPSCGNALKVQRLHCDSCGTDIEGLYELPLLMQLNDEDQKFIMSFVKQSGSLKKMARELGFSYPTVRNMLDNVIQKIDEIEKNTNNHEK